MKKHILTIALAAITTISFAQSWSWGLTIGTIGNDSKFTGGMTNAAAIFDHPTYGSDSWGVIFRKTLSTHFNFETGFKGVGLGFQYGIAQNYSLLTPLQQDNWNQASLMTVQLPASIIWNSNYNCCNRRWYVGVGASVVLVAKQNTTINTAISPDAAGNTNTSSYLDQTLQSNGVLAFNAHIVFGVEKLLKSGRMLNVGVWLNGGLSPLATSTVTYTAENQTYTHTFTNYGNFAGLTASYFFKPLGARKPSPKAVEAAVSPAPYVK
ncbi:MAG TPA: hypothetical protein VNZ45_14940 [Bacteroidia bacterium]|jgi:hypothetical protein|nr:hypothetical protein [Bacteroidia bacterium]